MSAQLDDLFRFTDYRVADTGGAMHLVGPDRRAICGHPPASNDPIPEQDIHEPAATERVWFDERRAQCHHCDLVRLGLRQPAVVP